MGRNTADARQHHQDSQYVDVTAKRAGNASGHVNTSKLLQPSVCSVAVVTSEGCRLWCNHVRNRPIRDGWNEAKFARIRQLGVLHAFGHGFLEIIVAPKGGFVLTP